MVFVIDALIRDYERVRPVLEAARTQRLPPPLEGMSPFDRLPLPAALDPACRKRAAALLRLTRAFTSNG